MMTSSSRASSYTGPNQRVHKTPWRPKLCSWGAPTLVKGVWAEIFLLQSARASKADTAVGLKTFAQSSARSSLENLIISGPRYTSNAFNALKTPFLKPLQPLGDTGTLRLSFEEDWE